MKANLGISDLASEKAKEEEKNKLFLACPKAKTLKKTFKTISK